MAASPSAVSLSQTHELDVMLPSVFSVANTPNTNYLYTVNVCIAYKGPPPRNFILRRDLTVLYTTT